MDLPDVGEIWSMAYDPSSRQASGPQHCGEVAIFGLTALLLFFEGVRVV